MTVRILVGECRERLREPTEGLIDCVVTSPVYAEMARDRVAGDVPAEGV